MLTKGLLQRGNDGRLVRERAVVLKVDEQRQVRRLEGCYHEATG